MTETRGRLVQKQKSRAQRQRAGNFNDALLPKRQLARRSLRKITQADLIERRHSLPGELMFLLPFKAQGVSDEATTAKPMGPDHDVLDHGAIIVQFNVLDGVRDAAGP